MNRKSELLLALFTGFVLDSMFNKFLVLPQVPIRRPAMKGKFPIDTHIPITSHQGHSEELRLHHPQQTRRRRLHSGAVQAIKYRLVD